MKNKMATLQDVINLYQAGDHQGALRILEPMLKRNLYDGRLFVMQSAILQHIPGRKKRSLGRHQACD